MPEQEHTTPGAGVRYLRELKGYDFCRTRTYLQNIGMRKFDYFFCEIR